MFGFVYDIVTEYVRRRRVRGVLRRCWPRRLRWPQEDDVNVVEELVFRRPRTLNELALSEGDEQVLECLVPLLWNPDWRIRMAAAKSIDRLWLTTRIDDPEEMVAYHFARGWFDVAHVGDVGSSHRAIEFYLKDENRDCRANAAHSAFLVGPSEKLDALVFETISADPTLAEDVADHLLAIDDGQYVRRFVRFSERRFAASHPELIDTIRRKAAPRLR